MSKVGRTLPAPRRSETGGSRVEQAATYLRRLIFSQYLVAGTRVPQDEIANALGMTRIPVREALLILELEGRVRIEHNRGAYVVAVSEQSAHDVVEVIAMMHGFAIRRAIDRVSPRLIADLHESNQRVQSSTDAVDLYYAFEAFQDLVVTAGLDERLAAFARRLRRIGPDTLYEQDPSISAIIKRTADRMFVAISQRDKEGVEAMLLESHNSVLDVVVPLLRDEGLMSD